MFSQLLALKGYTVHAFATDQSEDDPNFPLFSEEMFARLLSLERKRAERSRRSFVLMLADVRNAMQSAQPRAVLARMLVAIASAKRETDIFGWHKKDSVIGVIFTETGVADTSTLCDTIRSKVKSALLINLQPSEAEKVLMSFRTFPESSSVPGGPNGGSADIKTDLYPDLLRKTSAQKAADLIKRAVDITGSIVALTLLSPIFLAIAVAIKLTSKGPVLFKQQRVGQYGVWFTFLKFRSMYCNNDDSIHREYLRQFIAGKSECKQQGNNGAVYKMKSDPRITPLGRFLRKTSLDELPQFYNVLRGEMSLVGPRPPIPYEIEAYQIWHRRRFFEVKPGITGLWQVSGRSRLTFDEMVRLDIKYAREWSLWLDLKILLATPRVVLFGDGAY